MDNLMDNTEQAMKIVTELENELAPLDRKYFKVLGDAWGRQIDNQIAARLPPKKDAA